MRQIKFRGKRNDQDEWVFGMITLQDEWMDIGSNTLEKL